MSAHRSFGEMVVAADPDGTRHRRQVPRDQGSTTVAHEMAEAHPDAEILVWVCRSRWRPLSERRAAVGGQEVSPASRTPEAQIAGVRRSK